MFDSVSLYGESAASLEICARLTRVWAQRVCRNERPGTTKNIPYDGFDIVPRSSILVLKNIGFAWGGTAYEQLTKILKIDHSLHEANITCDAAILSWRNLRVAGGRGILVRLFGQGARRSSEIGSTSGASDRRNGNRGVGPD